MFNVLDHLLVCSKSSFGYHLSYHHVFEIACYVSYTNVSNKSKLVGIIYTVLYISPSRISLDYCKYPVSL